MRPIAIIIFLIAITLNATANILIKFSALKGEKGGVEGIIRGYLLNPWLILGVTCFALALVAYKYVLAQGMKLSITYPIMTTGGFAIVLVASRFLFHEYLNPFQWAGIGLIMAGIWLLAFQMAPGV